MRTDVCHPRVLFDPGNQGVDFFATAGSASARHRIAKVYVYKTATATWESYAAVVDNAAAIPVLANTAVWEMTENCVILGGHEFRSSQGRATPANRYFYC